MNFKKILAFITAGVVIVAIPAVSVSLVTEPLIVEAADNNATSGADNNSSGSATSTPTSVSYRATSVIMEEIFPEVDYDRGAEDFVRENTVAGIPLEVSMTAEAQGKTISEYMTNSIQTLLGLDEVTPVGQGGNVIIDGQASNVTFALDKPLNAHVDFAKSYADSINGKVMNVVNVKTNVVFENATVNFYAPGVVNGQNVQVYQYVNGEWVSVTVSEIRDDHVIVNMTSPGIFAFIEVQ